MIPRKQALSNLVSYNESIDSLVHALKAFGWDSRDELVILTCQHILNVLDRYLSREISATQLELWANAIEGREDIAFDPQHEASISDAIYQLANPLLTELISDESVMRMIQNLNKIP